MSKSCEYQGYYLDWDDDIQEEVDVVKCTLFTDEGEWNEYCYCDEEERNNCMLYKYSEYIKRKNEEIKQLKSENNNCKKEIEKINVVKKQLMNVLSRLEGSDKE